MIFFFFPFSFSLTAIFLLCKETVFALTASLLKTEKENRSVFQRPVRRIRKHFAIHSVQRQSIMQWCYVARHISIPDISPSNPFWSSQLFLLWAERTQSWVVKQIWRAVLIYEAAAVAFPPKSNGKKQEILRSRKVHLLFSNEAIKQKCIQSMKTGRNRFFAHVSARLQWQADVKKELTVPFINSPPPFSALPRGNASGTDSAN